jgi:hypothetical protein
VGAPADSERGQASVEAALLWLAIAVVLTALTAAIGAAGIAGIVAGAFTSTPHSTLGNRAEHAFEQSLGGRGPTMLAVAALAEAELGPRAGAAALRRQLLASLAARHPLDGELDVTRLATPGPGLSLRAIPAGPSVVVGIATADDEPTGGGSDLRAFGGDAPDAASAVLTAVGSRIGPPVHVLSHVGSAFDVANAVLTRLGASPPGAGPGERAGDVVFCRRYRAYWFRGRERAYVQAMGDVWRIAVLRSGAVIADRVVTRRTC